MYVASGSTWNTYLIPFAVVQEGSTTVLYHSTDTAGNIEPIATTTVKLDTTAPEAKIAFSTATKTLVVTGIDALSPVSASTSVVVSGSKLKQKEQEDKERKNVATVATTLADDAGNTTVLAYTEPSSDSERRDTATVVSVGYKGVTTNLSATTLQYKWNTNKKGEYTMFAAYLKTASSTIEAHYQPKKNVTTIMTKPQELDDREDDGDAETRPIRSKLPGLVIPGLQTEKGSVKIIY